jgi:prepilin-type N-terminal cleavage/methylation domain-containing protein
MADEMGAELMVNKQYNNKLGSYGAVCNAGFTLIEIMMVVVLLAVAGAMAMPFLSSAGSLQAMAAADIIAADLEYAKSLAISRAQVYSVVFSVGSESYQIEDQGGNLVPHPIKIGFNYVVDFANDSRLSQVDISQVSFDATSEVRFDYLGSPYNGSSTPLNSGTVTVKQSSLSRTVSVEPVTGIISVSD